MTQEELSAMALMLSSLKELVAHTESGFFSLKHDHVAMQDARYAIRKAKEVLDANLTGSKNAT